MSNNVYNYKIIFYFIHFFYVYSRSTLQRGVVNYQMSTKLLEPRKKKFSSTLWKWRLRRRNWNCRSFRGIFFFFFFPNANLLCLFIHYFYRKPKRLLIYISLKYYLNQMWNQARTWKDQIVRIFRVRIQAIFTSHVFQFIFIERAVKIF